MKNISQKVSNLFVLDFQSSVKYISTYFDDSFFEIFIAQKGPEKIYRNNIFADSEKKTLIACLQESMPQFSKNLRDIYVFIETFIPIGKDILLNIQKSISENFNDSLITFYFCLSKYVYDNPNIITTAKNILIDVAKKCLYDDLNLINYSFSVSLDNIYSKTKSTIDHIYNEAIKYGVLVEKYDSLSFGREYIEDINTINNKPKVSLKLINPNFEHGLQCGVRYHNFGFHKRYDDEAGLIESHYKCIICKYCTFFCVDDYTKEIAFSLLHRQFSFRNQTDMFYFFTGELPSYILSILAYIYTKFLILFFFTNKTMDIIHIEDIKKGMLWGEQISDDKLKEYYHLIASNKNGQKFVTILDDGIIIGKWQFDIDFSLIELSKSVSLNTKSSTSAGRNSNFFGKHVYEDIVRNVLSDNQWSVVPVSVKLKNRNSIATDIDLIAYNNGVVIIGQIKLADSGRSEYDIWKARKTINKAVSQIHFTLNKISNDCNLIYSILKKYSFCQNKNEIIKIIPVVITSSSYFIGDCSNEKISIISWDMFCQIIKSINHFKNLNEIDGYFENICSVFDFQKKYKFISSEIDVLEFNICYEEFEYFE